MHDSIFNLNVNEFSMMFPLNIKPHGTTPQFYSHTLYSIDITYGYIYMSLCKYKVKHAQNQNILLLFSVCDSQDRKPFKDFWAEWDRALSCRHIKPHHQLFCADFPSWKTTYFYYSSNPFGFTGLITAICASSPVCMDIPNVGLLCIPVTRFLPRSPICVQWMCSHCGP